MCAPTPAAPAPAGPPMAPPVPVATNLMVCKNAFVVIFVIATLSLKYNENMTSPKVLCSVKPKPKIVMIAVLVYPFRDHGILASKSDKKSAIY